MMPERAIIQVRANGPGSSRGALQLGGFSCPCALGKAGVIDKKREGDHATPLGRFALREVFYRPDRIQAPQTNLPCRALRTTDGWCDDPGHIDYNKAVTLPHPASCENLWRDDPRYDILVVLGYNDAPIIPGKGSAIFFHIAAPDFAGTEGCVAITLADMQYILAALTGPADMVIQADA